MKKPRNLHPSHYLDHAMRCSKRLHDLETRLCGMSDSRRKYSIYKSIAIQEAKLINAMMRYAEVTTSRVTS